MDTKRMETAIDLAASLAQFCATALTQPAKAVTHALAAGEGVINSLGRKVEVGSADKRFRDSVWNSNPGYKLLMSSYLAWSGSVTKWVDSLDVPARDKLRAKLVSSLVTDAVAPTNSLLGNPTAMKATLDQGGKNVLVGCPELPAGHDDQQRLAVDGRQVEVCTRQEPWAFAPARWSMPRIISS